LLVWLHAVTSIGWLSQALALFVPVVYVLRSTDPAAGRARCCRR